MTTKTLTIGTDVAFNADVCDLFPSRRLIIYTVVGARLQNGTYTYTLRQPNGVLEGVDAADLHTVG